MFPMPEKRIFPMKNLLHYGSWLITAGVEGSEPTNLVFCRYFERPTQFFYQSSKEWAQGGGSGPSARSGIGRLRESSDFVVVTICLLLLGDKWIAYFLCLEIRMVWAGRICIAREWVSDQIVIRPRLGYIWVNTHSSPPQHCWHCEIWFRDSYVTRTSLNFWTLNWKLGQRLNIWRDIIR